MVILGYSPKHKTSYPCIISIINIEKWQQHRRSASRNIFCIVFVSAIILSRISFVLHPSRCNNTYSNSQNQHYYLQLNHDQKLKHIYFKLLLACLTTKKQDTFRLKSPNINFETK